MEALVYIEEEEWDVVSRDVIDGKREQNRTRDHFARISLGTEV